MSVSRRERSTGLVPVVLVPMRKARRFSWAALRFLRNGSEVDDMGMLLGGEAVQVSFFTFD